jgi:hypothetical protein
VSVHILSVPSEGSPAISRELELHVAIWSIIGNIFLFLSICILPLTYFIYKRQQVEVDAERNAEKQRLNLEESARQAREKKLDDDVQARERAAQAEKARQLRSSQQLWAQQWERQVEHDERLAFAMEYLFEPTDSYEGYLLPVPQWALATAAIRPLPHAHSSATMTQPTFRVDRSWVWVVCQPKLLSSYVTQQMRVSLPVEFFLYRHCLDAYLRHMLGAAQAMEHQLTTLQDLPSTIQDVLFTQPLYLPVMFVYREDKHQRLRSLLYLLEADFRAVLQSHTRDFGDHLLKQGLLLNDMIRAGIQPSSPFFALAIEVASVSLWTELHPSSPDQMADRLSYAEFRELVAAVPAREFSAMIGFMPDAWLDRFSWLEYDLLQMQIPREERSNLAIPHARFLIPWRDLTHEEQLEDIEKTAQAARMGVQSRSLLATAFYQRQPPPPASASEINLAGSSSLPPAEEAKRVRDVKAMSRDLSFQARRLQAPRPRQKHKVEWRANMQVHAHARPRPKAGIASSSNSALRRAEQEGEGVLTAASSVVAPSTVYFNVASDPDSMSRVSEF